MAIPGHTHYFLTPSKQPILALILKLDILRLWCVDQHMRMHIFNAFLLDHCNMQFFSRHSSYINFHIYACFVIDIGHLLRGTIHEVEPKWTE